MLYGFVISVRVDRMEIVSLVKEILASRMPVFHEWPTVDTSILEPYLGDNFLAIVFFFYILLFIFSRSSESQ